jgi:hypothetical protein
MDTGKGWAQETRSDAVVAPSWNECSARMQQIAHRDPRQHDRNQLDSSINHRELARLQFVCWRYYTGRLDPAAPIDISTTDHDAACAGGSALLNLVTQQCHSSYLWSNPEREEKSVEDAP